MFFSRVLNRARGCIDVWFRECRTYLPDTSAPPGIREAAAGVELSARACLILNKTAMGQFEQASTSWSWDRLGSDLLVFVGNAFSQVVAAGE
jgi:hypothetical protein